MIHYSRQWVDEKDKQAVWEVLGADLLTQGPKVAEFERAVAQYCGAEFGVATNSATSALHLACLALDVKPGDWVWTSPNTFLASSNCALYCGAQVDFVDICPKTYNLSVAALEKKLVEAKRAGRLPKVIVLVHFAGQPCELKAIHALSQQYGFYIIEDAAHAIGSRYEDTLIGCGRYSHITTFSFHAVKTMTTAEGGMAVTNDPALYHAMKRFSSHGVTREEHCMTEASHGPWYYQMLALGYNYRLTELQAALGLNQLHKLNDFVMKRKAIAERYTDAFQALPLILPHQENNIRSSWHLYVVCLTEHASSDRKTMFMRLREAGIGVNVHYIPVHTQPYYQRLGFKWGDFPVAEAYYQQCISLPIHYGLSEAQQDYVVNTVKQVLE